MGADGPRLWLMLPPLRNDGLPQLNIFIQRSPSPLSPAFLAEDAALTQKTTPVGFEPTRGDPMGLAGRRLNRSAKVSL